jgi:PBSX family phage terminase large subunit
MKKLSETILPNFYDFWKAVKLGLKTFYIAKGGRGSSKSTTISIIMILLIVMFPITGLVIRKVADSMRGSVYEQLKEATILLEIEDEFIFSTSPLQIIYKGRGNSIIFRGANFPERIKSIKISKFPIAAIWFEELTEFKTEDEFQVIIDSVLRAKLTDGMTYKIFISYNPPKRKQHWLNRKFETQFIPLNTYVHHSYYYDNPYLSVQTLDEIEHSKDTNIKKYNWMYLGQPTGGGVVPFENLNFRTITDEEIKTFDNIRQGIDWGYASDPFAFTRWHYDKTRKKIYAMDEIYEVKLQNPVAMKKLKELGYDRKQIISDTEPKSIDEFRIGGFNIKGAKKGADSVEYGEKWLDGLEEIVIDPKRTPNIASEFEMIDYEIDKDGNQKPKLEDKNNHTIDSTRYAFEQDMQKSGTRVF